MSWTTSPPYSHKSASSKLPSDSSAPTTPPPIPSPKATPRSLALLTTGHAKTRTPISPQRLSKLANALGVSTPTPVSMPYSPTTPNSSSFGNSSSTPSRYLLHVIPPFHLYFAAQEDSGDAYEQAQFRRGTMVPLHPTLQSQLGAIAREYSLPSTGGMILYLITPDNDPGPKITDDAWRMLWYRALQVDKDGSVAGRSIAKLHSRSNTPSGSPYPSPSTAPDSPYHQLGSPHHKDSLSTTSLDFPINYNPSAAFPILAKVEFDIDRRKAPWYEHWRHRGRASSHSSLTASSQYSTGLPGSGSTKVLQLPLRARSTSPSLAEFKAKYTGSPSPSEDSESIRGGYARLGDSPNGKGRSVHLGQYTTDPLEDVFPSDGATWAQIRVQQGRMDENSESPHSPHTPDVAIGGRIGTVILGLEGAHDEEESVDGDEEDVVALWNARHKPTLNGLPAPSAGGHEGGKQRLASKHIPPPLDLSTSSKVQIPQLEIAPPTATSPNMRLNSDLPYLETSLTLDGDDDGASLKSAASSRRPSNASEEDRSRRLDELERRIESLSPKLAWQEENSTQEPIIQVDSPGSTSLVHGDGPSIAIEDIDKEETPNLDESTISSPLMNSLPVPSTKKARRQVSIGSYNAVPGAEELAQALAARSDSPPLPPLPQDEAKSNDASEQEALTLPPIDLATPVSPGFPISPDPFGRKPIFPDGQKDLESPPAVPAKTANEKSNAPVSLPPRVSSRFSADSVGSDGGQTPTIVREDRSPSINFGKGIRNLWRKSGNTKSPIQPLMSPGINGQHNIPNSPASKELNIPPLPSSAGGYFMPISTPMPQGNSSDRMPTSHGRSGSELDPFHFDQESRYPVHKMPSPSQAFRDTIPPKANREVPTTPSPSSPPPTPGQKKGILKGWGPKSGGPLKRLSTEFNNTGRSSPQASAHPPSSFNTNIVAKGGPRPSTDTAAETVEGGTGRHSKQSSKASVSSVGSGSKHAHQNNSISGTSHASSHQAPSIQLDTTSSSSSSPTSESPTGQTSPSTKSAGAALPVTPTGSEPHKSRQWL